MTGKNKTKFKEWLEKSDIKLRTVISGSCNYDFTHTPELEHLPFEMQIGVYLAYYDSLGIYIFTEKFINNKDQISWIYTMNLTDATIGNWFNSRNEAYKEAFKRANEIINGRFKKD